jgi:Putative peptidoglycan binding domain
MRRMRAAAATLIAVLIVVALTAAPSAAAGGGGTSVGVARTTLHNRGSANALTRRAMWIWEMQFVQHGNVGSIITQARRWGIGTLMIKSSDGTDFWSSQFTPGLVSAFHRAGLKVCAWQYVYGEHPVTEAYKGAEAIKDGADCLLIDAETQYEGKYIAAQTYMKRLRDLIGPRFPIALASFPYVDFHPAFPYSVFLGPGGAQYNVPQMYWKDIGTSVDNVFAHTYVYNTIYRRRIYPLGQVYNRPAAHQIFRFRQLSRAYGASGISWWDWQEATNTGWNALSRPAGSLKGYVADRVMASIKKGSKGDLVVWAQEHLVSAGYKVGIDGGFGPTTQSAVQNFQTAHGLTDDGIVGPETWASLLRYRPVNVVFGAKTNASRAALARASSVRGGVLHEPVPVSARRPARRDEVSGAGGGGRPRQR